MCDIAIRIKPYTPEAYYHRSISLMKMKIYGEALSDINCAISCESLISFQRSEDINLLIKSIEHSFNNLEAIQLLKWIDKN